jgi:hypothetical protein
MRAFSKLALRGNPVIGGEVVATHVPYCDDPVTIHRAIRAGGHFRSLAVTQLGPCRKCAKCLKFRQMLWRERCLLETAQAKRTWFVTLTFAPMHLAGVMQEARLLPTTVGNRVDRAAYGHVQRYFKRLRKNAPQSRFRYLAVFERGEETGRPHYHLMLHEVGARPLTRRVIDANWRSFTHAKLVNEARNGMASYITKYLTKDLSVRPRPSQRYGRNPSPRTTP